MHPRVHPARQNDVHERRISGPVASVGGEETEVRLDEEGMGEQVGWPGEAVTLQVAHTSIFRTLT